MKPFLAQLYTLCVKNKDKRQRIYDLLTNGGGGELATLDKIFELPKATNEILRATTIPTKIPQATGDLRLHQLASLEILKRLTAFLDKHNIEYWLYAGTLIGAMRHKGFVPWDDDIDIAMTRPNYERFQSMIDEFCQNGLSYTDGDIVRIFYIGATAQVDIFPFDFGNSVDLPPKDEYDNLIKKFWEIYNKIPFDNSVGHIPKATTIPKDYLQKLKQIYQNEILQNKPIPPKAYLFHSFHAPAYARVLCRYDEIFPLKKIEFEGYEFSAPNDSFMHLHRKYGNFMNLPKTLYSHEAGRNLSKEQILKDLELIGAKDYLW